MPMRICKCCYDVYASGDQVTSEHQADNLCQTCGDAWKRQGVPAVDVPASSIEDIRANIEARASAHAERVSKYGCAAATKATDPA